MEISGKIAQANGRLKSGRVGVRIEQIGEKLYLQATLPPRPTSRKTKPHQQRISLGVGAHPAGVKLAENEARIVGALLDAGKFEWTPYLKGKFKPAQSVGEWVERFEAAHRSKMAAVTWRSDYQEVFNSLPIDRPLTVELLQKAIEATPENTRTRRRWCLTLGRLAKFAGLECDFKLLQGSYSASRVDPRELPTDEQIVEWFGKIQNPAWRWVYGAIATYGLRNHEAFFLDAAALEQGGWMVRVTEGKTGSHDVWPCYPEWVEQFDLRRKLLPDVNGADHAAYGQRVTQYFSRISLPFTALDLRHCWARRTLEFGLPVELAARQMGHSVEVHTNTYHRWLSADVHERAFRSLMLRSDRPLPPKN
ncbi:site-specific integrase [Microcoleus sp. FACHB-1515]|uniref:site-specific integrase n=1 Tax=Cyanophyceae TaxID=3028117 RepID=UPI00168292CE|nr:site-specific integrase [Microcoleus sp. FACHB-1515]MBD2088890.1 site-specific integrase [Microcoleus sp. FACHB-1515]